MVLIAAAVRRATRALRVHSQQRASLSTHAGGIQIIETVADFHAFRRQLPATATVGLVPTMGGLHDGHMSLVRAARNSCDVVCTSIFVNPTQFGPNEDFSKYPRTFEADVALLQREGVDVVFCPAASDMYARSHRCYVTPEGFDDLAEGRCRPGHFRGVATVVAKLLNIVRPTRAYFGEKDAAQCVLIRRLVNDLSIDVAIDVVAVCREADGLAMSTRNQYLAADERKAAGVVYRGLVQARDLFDAAKRERSTNSGSSGSDNATIDAQLLRDAICSEYEREPLVTEIQYISVGSRETMDELTSVDVREGAVLSVAVKLGKCRLIDTLTLE